MVKNIFQISVPNASWRMTLRFKMVGLKLNNKMLIAEIRDGDTAEDVNSGQNSVISEVSLVAKEDDTLDSPVKNTWKVIPCRQCGCKVKMSSELKSKLEEEKDLKKEVDKLEYEVLQSEKVQDNIDKLREKLHNLCK